MGTKFSERQRFNWGYWDARDERLRTSPRDMTNHHDRAYAAGYGAGLVSTSDHGQDTSSDFAWSVYLALKKTLEVTS